MSGWTECEHGRFPPGTWCNRLHTPEPGPVRFTWGPMGPDLPPAVSPEFARRINRIIEEVSPMATFCTGTEHVVEVFRSADEKTPSAVVAGFEPIMCKCARGQVERAEGIILSRLVHLADGRTLTVAELALENKVFRNRAEKSERELAEAGTVCERYRNAALGRNAEISRLERELAEATKLGDAKTAASIGFVHQRDEARDRAIRAERELDATRRTYDELAKSSREQTERACIAEARLVDMTKWNADLRGEAAQQRCRAVTAEARVKELEQQAETMKLSLERFDTAADGWKMKATAAEHKLSKAIRENETATRCERGANAENELLRAALGYVAKSWQVNIPERSGWVEPKDGMKTCFVLLQKSDNPSDGHFYDNSSTETAGTVRVHVPQGWEIHPSCDGVVTFAPSEPKKDGAK